MDSVAITDHGKCSGLISLKKECKEVGISPIYGIELYVAPGDNKLKEKVNGHTKTAYHLTVLAKNQEGLKNIFRLTSDSWINGFYYKPRTSTELLKRHSEGLVVLSGCGSGRLSQLLMNGNIDEAEAHLLEYRDIWGEDFYIEVQNHNLDWELPLRDLLFRYSEYFSVPIVATQDSHYLTRNDADLHRAICKISAGDLEFEGNESYFKPCEDMEKMFRPEQYHAIYRTQEIADKCKFDWEYGKTIWPVYALPNDITPKQELRRLVYEGFTAKFGDGIQEYKDRLEYELDIIEKMDFPTYFLIVQDFLNWARSKGIPVGPGRGSAAGSLVCYCIGITEVDPIKYGLYFERFLNPSRVSLPDIDSDMCRDRRGEIIEYVINKYGQDRVSQIGTSAIFKPRGSLRAFARVLGKPISVGDYLASLIPPDDAGKALSFEKVIEREPKILDPEYNDVVSLARAAENLISQNGVHAAGIVISDEPLTEYVPLFCGKHEEVATQFDMHGIEDIGLVKYDFLGLKNLTSIQKTIDLIKHTKGIDIDIGNINEQDSSVFKDIFHQGDLAGVFQFETSSGFKELCIKVRPESIKDLAAISSLYRPGPIKAKLLQKYVDGRNGGYIEYAIPGLEPILKDTFGVMCLPLDTKIRTAYGEENIQDIKPGDKITTSDGHMTWDGEVDRIWKSSKPIIQFRLSNGDIISSSHEHIWLTTEGDLSASDFHIRETASFSGASSRIGTMVYSHWQESTNDINLGDKAYILGLLVGDGELKLGTKPITCHSQKQAQWIAELISVTFGGEPKTYHNTRAWCAYSKFNTSPYKSPLTIFLDEEYGIDKWQSKSHNKKLPDRILSYGYETRIALLRGLWDSDGHYGKSLIYYRSVSKQLLHDIGRLLSSLKIAYAIRDDYVYIIDRRAFCKQIVPRLPEKIYKCELNNLYYPPIPISVIKNCLTEVELEYKDYLQKKQLNRRLALGGMYKPSIDSRMWNIGNFSLVIEKAYQISYLQQTWPVMVEDKKDLPETPCYDIQMKNQKYPYFFANNVISHNCFQEQVMKICTDIAGYTLAEADNMRKIIGKKLPEKMKLEREKFVGGCVTNSISLDAATKLFDDIEGFASYSFNLAHAVAYSVISYRTAWLKKYYPLEFYCSLFNCSLNDQDDLVKYFHAAKDNGINIQPPDINISSTEFTINNNSIIFGLAGIKGLGEKACNIIISTKPDNGFESIEQLIRLGINRGAIKSLIPSGALSTISDIDRCKLLFNIDVLADYYEKLIKWEDRELSIAKREQEIKLAIESGIKPPRRLPKNKDRPIIPDILDIPQLEARDKTTLERESLGFYLSSHPMDKYPGLEKLAKNTIDNIRNGEIEDGSVVSIPAVVFSIEEKTTKRQQKMAILVIEDRTGRIETTIFPSQWKKLSGDIEIDTVYMIDGIAKVTEVDSDSAPIVKMILNSIRKIDKDIGRQILPVDVHLLDGTEIRIIPAEGQDYTAYQRALSIANNMRRMQI